MNNQIHKRLSNDQTKAILEKYCAKEIDVEKAIKENKSLFRPFKIPSPYKSSKDIFCLRYERTTNAYRKISFEGLELKIPVNPYEKVELRIIPDEQSQMGQPEEL